ncbi:dual specificity protein phosphatase 5 [Carcharodon carcharias]|uniref:dual specificity protein phosphatase 5 n=1 Tax=Carcharodon carcharias TaxID=13397 RepID=UPI001B7E4666|nr:dual specificity protein phosphatase 5 [Carcharodon carcharias]
MTVSGIDSQRLRKFIRKQTGRNLILDCRPFLSFAASHVQGSHNVNLNSVVVRRSRGGPVPLQFVIPDEKARARLREGRVSTVVILDERTSQSQRLSKDSTAQIVLNTLTAVTSTAKIYFLKGGYEDFHSQYPECCSELKPSLNYTSVQEVKETDASHMNQHEKPCSNRRPVYDQGKPVEILPFLYLGSAYHASRPDFLDDLHITALLNVSRDCAEYFKSKYHYKFIPVEDSATADMSSHFQEAIDFIDHVRHTGGKVLVHCEAGISRSPTICLAYLMRSKELRLEEAFDYIKERRNTISPNFGFMNQLLQYESEIVSLAPTVKSCKRETVSCSAEELTYNKSLESSVYTFPSSLLNAVPIPSPAHQFEFSPIKLSLSC